MAWARACQAGRPLIDIIDPGGEGSAGIPPLGVGRAMVYRSEIFTVQNARWGKERFTTDYVG